MKSKKNGKGLGHSRSCAISAVAQVLRSLEMQDVRTPSNNGCRNIMDHIWLDIFYRLTSNFRKMRGLFKIIAGRGEAAGTTALRMDFFRSCNSVKIGYTGMRNKTGQKG